MVGVKDMHERKMTINTLFTLSKIDSKWWIYYGIFVLQVSDEHVVNNIKIQIVILNMITTLIC